MIHINRLFKSTSKKVWYLPIIAVATTLLIYSSGVASADTTHSFTGILKDQGNTPIKDVSVSLRNTQGVATTVVTGVDGSFNIAVQPDMYSLKLSYQHNSSLSKFSLAQPLTNPSIDLTDDDINQDLTLPLSTVNFALFNAQGYPTQENLSAVAPKQSIPAVALFPGGVEMTADDRTYYYYNSHQSNTGSFRTITGTSYASSYDDGICLREKNGGKTFCNIERYTVTDHVHSIDLPRTPAPRNTFSGVFRDSTGAPMNETSIGLYDGKGNSVHTTTTSDGSFNIAVQPGVYYMSTTRNTTVNGVGLFRLSQNASNPSIDLTTDNIVQNLSLPVGLVNFVAYDDRGSLHRYGSVTARGQGTTPVSLYPNGKEFNHSTSDKVVRSTTSANINGIGTFKAILGARYAGTSSSDGICSIKNTTTYHCNKAPLTVGVSDVILGP